MPTPESTLSSSDPPDPPPIATRTPNTSPTPMDDDNMAVSARTRASTRTSASTATTTTFPFATTSLSSQDIHTFNSSTSSLDPPHQPPLQRQVYTYQLPVRMNGGKIVYITKVSYFFFFFFFLFPSFSFRFRSYFCFRAVYSAGYTALSKDKTSVT